MPHLLKQCPFSPSVTCRKNASGATLWLFNIAMENCKFTDDFPLKPPFIIDFP
jgi:hypothetical protein